MINKRTPMELLASKGVVQVFLDAAYSGVVVPPEFNGTISLNFSYRFAPGDLTIDDFGIRSTLSFGGKPFGVEVPWSAVKAMVSLTTQEGVEFDLEPDGPTVKRAVGDFQSAEVAKFKLSVVPDEPGITKTYSPPRTGHLRLLKN